MVLNVEPNDGQQIARYLWRTLDSTFGDTFVYVISTQSPFNAFKCQPNSAINYQILINFCFKLYFKLILILTSFTLNSIIHSFIDLSSDLLFVLCLRFYSTFNHPFHWLSFKINIYFNLLMILIAIKTHYLSHYFCWINFWVKFMFCFCFY